MKKTIIILFFLTLTVFISGCNKNEVKPISKEGSIETLMSVNHLDETHDILITTHNVWVKNVLTKRMVYKDTIPTLGNISQGVPGNADSTKIVSPKKDYEVYITVQ